jgi:hypothetical protein
MSFIDNICIKKSNFSTESAAAFSTESAAAQCCAGMEIATFCKPGYTWS